MRLFSKGRSGTADEPTTTTTTTTTPPQRRSLTSSLRATPRFSLQQTRSERRAALAGNGKNPTKRQSWFLTKFPGAKKYLWLLFTTVAIEMILIALYLGLVLTLKEKMETEYHIVLVILIVVATIGVGYAVIRVCLSFSRGKPMGEKARGGAVELDRAERGGARRGSLRRFARTGDPAGRSGYGTVSAGDGDVYEHYQPGHSAPPPVYGCWRQSVRIDPANVQYYYPQNYNPPPTPVRENITNNTSTLPLQRNPTAASAVSALSESPPSHHPQTALGTTTLHRNPTSQSAVSVMSTADVQRRDSHRNYNPIYDPVSANGPVKVPPPMLRLQTTRPGERSAVIPLVDGEPSVSNGRERDSERMDARQRALAQLGGLGVRRSGSRSRGGGRT